MKNLQEMYYLNIPMLDEIINKLQTSPKNNLNILDLSCGSGFNSTYIYSKLQTGTYTLVDISQKNISSYQEDFIFDYTIIESDFLSYLKSCPDNSMDVITFSYGISYYYPKKIIKECSRVLKNGGLLGVIECSKKTFPEIKKILPILIINHYNLINNFIFKSHYFRNEFFFEKFFVDNRFNRLNLSSNSHTINFKDNASIYSFISCKDIFTPLDSKVNISHPDAKFTIMDFLYNNNINVLTHKYIWGTFRNDK